jgi:hypothetical protein
MLQDHRDHGDHAAHDKGHNRHQQSAQTNDAINGVFQVTLRRFSGGADRDRTGGLLVANQALSQLSYSPNSAIGFGPLALSQTEIGLAKGQELTAMSDSGGPG